MLALLVCLGICLRGLAWVNTSYILYKSNNLEAMCKQSSPSSSKLFEDLFTRINMGRIPATSPANPDNDKAISIAKLR